MIITTEGTIIRIAAADISTSGRNTTGVKLINMDAGKEIKVARFTKVKENTASGDSDKALENLQSEFERESDPVEEEEPETDENITNETNAYDDEQADISKTFTKEDSGIETLIERALKDKENEEEKAGDDSTESSDNDNLN